MEDFVRRTIILMYGRQRPAVPPPGSSASDEDWQRHASAIRLADLRARGDECYALPAWDPLTQHARSAAWAATYAAVGYTEHANHLYPDVFRRHSDNKGVITLLKARNTPIFSHIPPNPLTHPHAVGVEYIAVCGSRSGGARLCAQPAARAHLPLHGRRLPQGRALQLRSSGLRTCMSRWAAM